MESLTEDDFTFNEDSGKLEIDMKRFGYKTGPMKKQIIEDSEKWTRFDGLFQMYEGGIGQFLADFLNNELPMQKENKQLKEIVERVKELGTSHSIVCNGHCCDFHEYECKHLLDGLTRKEGDC